MHVFNLRVDNSLVEYRRLLSFASPKSKSAKDASASKGAHRIWIPKGCPRRRQIPKYFGDDLTRENVLKQATDLHHVEPDLLPSGFSSVPRRRPTSASTSNCVKFDGEHRQAFGPIVTEAAKE
jgi:hypothetical protein